MEDSNVIIAYRTCGDLEFAIASALPETETRIYVYCRTGIKATFAARTLIDRGYSNSARLIDSFKDR